MHNSNQNIFKTPCESNASKVFGMHLSLENWTVIIPAEFALGQCSIVLTVLVNNHNYSTYRSMTVVAIKTVCGM